MTSIGYTSAPIEGVPYDERGGKFLNENGKIGDRLSTYFGDFVSYYLALINDIDPSDIEVINYLKQKLAQA